MRAFEKVVNFPPPLVVALQKAQKQAQNTCQNRLQCGTLAIRKTADKRFFVSVGFRERTAVKIPYRCAKNVVCSVDGEKRRNLRKYLRTGGSVRGIEDGFPLKKGGTATLFALYWAYCVFFVFKMPFCACNGAQEKPFGQNERPKRACTLIC